ncbi:MAG TPA: hypothetical protein VKQ30_15010 [Ktedonobacterales bacterium]|nr:hypothetical protein [Ktedonobacterales bacterium]
MWPERPPFTDATVFQHAEGGVPDGNAHPWVGCAQYGRTTMGGTGKTGNIAGNIAYGYATYV